MENEKAGIVKCQPWSVDQTFQLLERKSMANAGAAFQFSSFFMPVKTAF
jgi:hypothetical protein